MKKLATYVHYIWTTITVVGLVGFMLVGLVSCNVSMWQHQGLFWYVWGVIVFIAIGIWADCNRQL
jgi:hypothetical protein